MIRVLIADDHQIVRDGLKSLLSPETGIQVVAEAADGEEAKGLLSENEIDVALLDINMPKLNGLQVTEHINTHHPSVKVLILSMFKGAQYITSAINIQAKGYMLKDNVDREELIGAITMVANGGEHFGDEIMRIHRQAHQKAYMQNKDQEKASLTRRELEVLGLIADGLTSKKISTQLHIETSTVETHRRNLFTKLEAKNAVVLVRKAIQGGYISE